VPWPSLEPGTAETQIKSSADWGFLLGKNIWACTSISPYFFVVWCPIRHRIELKFVGTLWMERDQFSSFHSSSFVVGHLKKLWVSTLWCLIIGWLINCKKFGVNWSWWNWSTVPEFVSSNRRPQNTSDGILNFPAQNSNRTSVENICRPLPLGYPVLEAGRVNWQVTANFRQKTFLKVVKQEWNLSPVTSKEWLYNIKMYEPSIGLRTLSPPPCAPSFISHICPPFWEIKASLVCAGTNPADVCWCRAGSISGGPVQQTNHCTVSC
jgi:hypothetical protein